MIVIPVDIAVEKYINMHRACSSARTVQYYDECLSRFLDYIDNISCLYAHDIDKDMYMSYVQHLRNSGIKNVSVNTYCRAIRSWCSWLIDNDYLHDSFVEGVKQLRDDSSQIYPITSKQVNEIDNYFVDNVRDYIIFHLMLDCGLRRQEVINLNCEDVKYNCLVINNSKYNKSRLVPLPEELYYIINSFSGSSGPGPLLLDRFGKRITSNCIKKIFSNIRTNVGIHVNPHQLRHTFATSFIMGGGNLEFLRILLGHGSYNVTQKYLHVAAQCMIADVDVYRLDKCFFKNYNNGGY